MLRTHIAEVNRINTAIKSILEDALNTLLRDLEGVDPTEYRPYFVSESGLYILEGDMLVLASMRMDGEYGPGFTVPMDVLESGDLDQWIAEEKVRRVQALETERSAEEERERKRLEGRKRIFRGCVE